MLHDEFHFTIPPSAWRKVQAEPPYLSNDIYLSRCPSHNRQYTVDSVLHTATPDSFTLHLRINTIYWALNTAPGFCFLFSHHWTLIRHFIKAWQNFRKARYLWYAEKLFWFMAKVLGFVIYKWSASNEDFLKSSWIRQSSNLNFPPLEYVSDFEPGSHANQWQWS